MIRALEDVLDKIILTSKYNEWLIAHQDEPIVAVNILLAEAMPYASPRRAFCDVLTGAISRLPPGVTSLSYGPPARPCWGKN